MQRYEITVDGAVQHVDYATQVEADEAAITARQSNQGKNVEVRAKDGDGKPAVDANGIMIGNGQTQKSNPPPAPGLDTGTTSRSTSNYPTKR